MTIPRGWKAHDGAGLPAHRWSRPAIQLRCGVRTRLGHRDAWEWGSRWTWTAGSSGGDDIVAWLEEPDEFVLVPRLA